MEKFLLSKVFEDPDDIKVRKLLVNTFVREVIWYGDHIVITYNFQERFSTERFSKSYVEDIEKQVEEQSRSASSFPLSSYIVTHSAPRHSGSARRITPGAPAVSWRRRRDLNSCHRYRCYSLSRGAPWASWVLLQTVTLSSDRLCPNSIFIITYFFSIVKDFSGKNIKSFPFCTSFRNGGKSRKKLSQSPCQTILFMLK